MSCVGQGEGIGASCSKPLLCAPVSTWRVCLGLREREEQLVWGVETAASSAVAIISHPIPGKEKDILGAPELSLRLEKMCSLGQDQAGVGGWVCID